MARVKSDPKAKSSKLEARSLAIDPGYDRVGVAVFKGKNIVFSTCYSPDKGPFPKRLAAVYSFVCDMIKTYHPESLALETLFFSKNVKTAIAVAEARGVIELAAAMHNIPLYEYSPQAVKIAVTGSGNAAKDAVIRMVERLVPLEKRKRLDDEYDAIALGIAHTATRVLSTR